MPNFGILQGIQPPQVIGSLPSTPARDGVGELMGGIMSGLQQGQQLQNQKKEGQLLDLKIQSGKLDLSDRQAANDYANKLDQAAQQGMDAYLKALNPTDRINVLTKQAQQREAEAKARKEGVESGYSVSTYNAVAHSSAQQFKTPEEQEKAYQSIRMQAPEDVRSTMPTNFDPKYAPIAVASGLQAEAAMLRSKHGAATGGAPTDTQKRINEINQNRARQGLEPLPAQEESKYLTQGLTTSISPNKGQVNPYDTALAQNDAKQAGEATTLRTNMETLHTNAQTVLQKLPSVPDFALGPISKKLKIDKLSPEAQQIISPLNAMAFQLKEYYKLGSGQGFTDADRDFLTEIAGNTGYYKYPLKEIVTRMDKLAATARYNSWKKENNIRKNSSTYQQWLQDNPEPSKSWENQAQANSFQEGRVYQDANGNKAKYINGKWESI